jgi:hypothetical protein
MIETLASTRMIVIKHIMQRVCDNEMTIESGLRLIAAFEEEHQLCKDSVDRYQRACFQITDNRTVVIGP